MLIVQRCRSRARNGNDGAIDKARMLEDDPRDPQPSRTGLICVS